MFFDSSATLMLRERSRLISSQNHASDFGGAIFHEDITIPLQCKFDSQKEPEILKLPYCFIILEDYKARRPTIISWEDTAEKGGNFMFGGLLGRCQLSKGDFGSYVSHQVLTNNFNIDGYDGAHAMTSQPYQLCFCASSGNNTCSGMEKFQVHRGQEFSIFLTALDQLTTSVSTTVTAKIHKTARMKLNQSSQVLQPNCSSLSYAIFSTEHHEQVVLYPHGPCSDTGLARAVINVTLLPCPDGFFQSNEMCICEERLKELDADCIIDRGIYIRRRSSAKFWINATYENQIY